MVTHFEDLSDGANKVRIEDQEEEGSFYEQIDKIFVEKSLSLVCFYGRIDKYLKIAENPKRTSSQSSVDAIEETIELANNSNDSIVKTAGRESKYVSRMAGM